MGWSGRAPALSAIEAGEGRQHAMSQNLNNAVAVIGIDIGKNSFHVVGLDTRGAIKSGCGRSGREGLPGINILIELGEVRAIGSKAFLGHDRLFVNGRQTQCRSPLKDDLAIVEEERRRQHVERFRTGTLRRIDCACNLFGHCHPLIESSTPRVRASSCNTWSRCGG
jgi:hypothetical protein